MIDCSQIASMDAAALRSVVGSLLGKIYHDRREIPFSDVQISTRTFEISHLKRIQYGQLSEKLTGEKKQLFDEAVASDLAALEQTLSDLTACIDPPAPSAKQPPKRALLPAHLRRVDHYHEPASTICPCGCALKRIGNDVSEKLDYGPATSR